MSAKTALAQTPVTLGGVDGIDIFATAEHPDVANGNTITHNPRHLFAIRNNHATEYIRVTPVVQRTITEGSDTIALTPVTPTEIDGGEMFVMGPFSAANFKKAQTNAMEFTFALESGTIVAADVDIAVVLLP